MCELLEDRWLLATGVYPELPGLHLVDPRPDQFEGQIIYLDFDGAEDVTYNGPVVVEGIDIPAFQAPSGLAGQEEQIIADVVACLEATFADTRIIFTTGQPDRGSAYSTVFVGGHNTAFSEYGEFLGLSETVDIGNQNKTDEAFVFSAEFGPFDSSVTAANALAHIIEHEAGHLLGFAHENGPKETLGDFAYENEVYWAARDMGLSGDWLFNHHFIVITFSGSAPQEWGNNHIISLGGGEAMIVGGQASDPDYWPPFENDPPHGVLYADYLNAADVQATKDWFNNVAGDWHPELESMDIPSGLDFDSFSTVLYELTGIYDDKVDFHLNPELTGEGNCATFANTVMAKAGVPESEREEKSNFGGLDLGEDESLPNFHFDYLQSVDASNSSPAKGDDFELTATTKATAALSKVEFYWDSDRDGKIEPDSDEKICTDSTSSNGWTCDVSTDSLSTGEHLFFARTYDKVGDRGKWMRGKTITVTAPSITVTDPDGGESWQRGTTQEIAWDWSGNPGSNVKIDLYKGGSFDSTIKSSTSNDGSYDWPISSSQTVGTNYKVKITSTSNSSYYDYSDNNFSVTAAPTITVTDPDGGESWQRGTSHDITWDSAGNPGSNVKIELYKGGSFNRTITSSTSNDGTYNWSIVSSQTVGTDYKVKITSTSNSSYNDYSNSDFSITSAPLPSLSINDVSLTEGNSGTKTFDFTVSMSGSNPSGASVNYATLNGTAVSGSDYVSKNDTLTWAAGNTSSQTISITVNGDSIEEPNETFFVILSGASGATITDADGSNIFATGTIENDDTTPAPSLSINDVSLTEGNSETKTFNFTVSMSGSNPDGASVSYFTANGTATAGSDYVSKNDTLTWAAGNTSSQTISITVNVDTTKEPNETFSVNLSAASGATISDGQGIGTIQNDDSGSGGSVLFFDDFPSSTIDTTKWTNVIGATIGDVGIGEPSSPYSLRLDSAKLVESKTVDLSGSHSAALSYFYEETGGGESPGPGDDLVLDYWSGSSWVELERQLGSGPDMGRFVQSVVALPSAALHSGFRFRFRNISTSWNFFDDWFVDDVEVTGYSGAPAAHSASAWP